MHPLRKIRQGLSLSLIHIWMCIRDRKITFCALFAALTAILSQIAIPIGPVPINLATLAVFIAGGLMGPVWGAVSMIVYVALGAVGVPVFAMFTGGISIIVGPTGGYIIAVSYTHLKALG